MSNKQLELTNAVSRNAERESKPKSSAKLEPQVTIGRTCPICKETYALSHPKDYKPLCDKCATALREIIEERRKNEI